MQNKTVKISNFFERIEQILNYYSIKSINIFAKEYLGYKSSEKINRLKKENNSPSFEILNDISNKFEDVNTEWLLTGRGEMLKAKEYNSELPSVGETSISYSKSSNNNLQIPIVDINVAAGTGAINPDYIEIEDTVQIPYKLVKGCEQYLCVKITGESMAPTLQDSSYLVIGQIHPGQWQDIPDRHIYVIVDKEGNAYVKRLKNRFNKGFVVCMSDNVDKSRYPSFNIDADNIHGIWHAEWYFTAKMENINENYYSRLQQVEDRLDSVETMLNNKARY